MKNFFDCKAMQTLLCLSLAIAMCVPLTGCGNKGQERTAEEYEQEIESLREQLEEKERETQRQEQDATSALPDEQEHVFTWAGQDEQERHERIFDANVNAKMCYTALLSQLTQEGIANVELTGTVIEGHGTTAEYSGKTVDLSDYLGDDFTGYYYAEYNPETYFVKFAVWSPNPIPLEYKCHLCESELEYAADTEGLVIGCYPIESEDEIARHVRIIDANENAKICHMALSSQLTREGVSNAELTGTVIEGHDTIIEYSGKTVDLSDWLGDDFTGYCYAEYNPEKYYIEFALWSASPIPDEYKCELSKSEQDYASDVEGLIIGCYPLW